MDNKFTTVISYDKPTHCEQSAGRTKRTGDVVSLLKATIFMLLWMMLTAALLAEPLMSNSSANNSPNERANFTLGAAPAASPAKQCFTVQPASPVQVSKPKLNVQPHHQSPEPSEARLSYALLSVK